MLDPNKLKALCPFLIGRDVSCLAGQNSSIIPDSVSQRNVSYLNLNIWNFSSQANKFKLQFRTLKQQQKCLWLAKCHKIHHHNLCIGEPSSSPLTQNIFTLAFSTLQNSLLGFFCMCFFPPTSSPTTG